MEYKVTEKEMKRVTDLVLIPLKHSIGDPKWFCADKTMPEYEAHVFNVKMFAHELKGYTDKSIEKGVHKYITEGGKRRFFPQIGELKEYIRLCYDYTPQPYQETAEDRKTRLAREETEKYIPHVERILKACRNDEHRDMLKWSANYLTMLYACDKSKITWGGLVDTQAMGDLNIMYCLKWGLREEMEKGSNAYGSLQEMLNAIRKDLGMQEHKLDKDEMIKLLKGK